MDSSGFFFVRVAINKFPGTPFPKTLKIKQITTDLTSSIISLGLHSCALKKATTLALQSKIVQKAWP